MHELGLAQSIAAIVREESSRRNCTARRVELTIGSLADVVPEALCFAFEAIAAGTELESTDLAITQVDAVFSCRECTHQYTVPGPDFSCRRCGAMNVDMQSGDSLDITAIEFDDSRAGPEGGDF